MDQRNARNLIETLKKSDHATFQSLAEKYDTSVDNVILTIKRATDNSTFSQMENLSELHEKQNRSRDEKKKPESKGPARIQIPEAKQITVSDLRISEKFLKSEIDGKVIAEREAEREEKKAEEQLEIAKQNLVSAKKKVADLQDEIVRKSTELKEVQKEISKLEGLQTIYLISPNYSGEIPEFFKKLISTQNNFGDERVEITKLPENEWADQPSFELIRKSGTNNLDEFAKNYEFAQLALRWVTTPECKVQILFDKEEKVLKSILDALGIID